MLMLSGTARLLLCQESKDDDAVAVKPVYGLLVYFFRICRMYHWPQRICERLDAQPLFRFELNYATDTSCFVILPSSGMVFTQALTVVIIPT
jgi:hypothetical protein